jgi:hypothetical protein
MDIELLLTLSATVTGLLEFIKNAYLKPLRDNYKLSDNAYRTLVYLIALALGIATAVIAGDGANVLRLWRLGTGVSTELRDVAGLIMGGILISFGNEFIHLILDLTKAVRNVTDAKTSKVWQEVTSGYEPPAPASPVTMKTDSATIITGETTVAQPEKPTFVDDDPMAQG